MFLAGHIVAMVTYFATKLTATCSPMTGQFVDTMILASTGIEWLYTPGPNDLKIGHLGQVCTLCIFSYQTLHTALDKCLDHFQSKKNVKMSYCDVIFDDITKTWYTNFLISNHQMYHLKEHY